MSQCPDTEILLSHLHGLFEGPEREAVELHVDTCAACDGRLRELRKLEKLYRKLRPEGGGVGCPPLERLAGFLDRSLAADARGAVEAHVAGCARCLDLVAALHDERAMVGIDLSPALLLRLQGLLPSRSRSRTSPRISNTHATARRAAVRRASSGPSLIPVYAAAAGILVLGLALLVSDSGSSGRRVDTARAGRRDTASAPEPAPTPVTVPPVVARAPEAPSIGPVPPPAAPKAPEPPAFSANTPPAEPKAATPAPEPPAFTSNPPAPQPKAVPEPAPVPPPVANVPPASSGTSAVAPAPAEPVAIDKLAGMFQLTRARVKSTLKGKTDILPGDHLAAVGRPAQFTLSNGTVVSVNAGAELGLARDAEFTRLTLTGGEIFVEAPKGTRDFRASTRDAEAIIQGTAYELRFHHGSTELIVTEGQVLFKTAKNEVTVAAGYQSEADGDGAKPARPADFTRVAQSWRAALAGAPARTGGIATAAGELVFAESFDGLKAGRLALRRAYAVEPGSGWGIPNYEEKEAIDAQIAPTDFRKAGGKSLTLARGSTAKAGEPVILYSPALPLRRDSAYEVRFTVRTTAASPQKFKAYVFGEEGSYGHWFRVAEFTAGPGWQEFTVAAVVPAAAKFPEDRRTWLRVDWPSTEGDLWIDEIQVYRK